MLQTSLERRIAELEARLVKQSEIVESMIRTSYRGLRERCGGTASEVLAMETVINRAEVEIEEAGFALIALHQPVASDLRRVMMIIKVNGELERIADLALNLAERTESLTAYPDFQVPEQLDEMVSVSLAMFRRACSALVDGDLKLAAEVCQMDATLDDLNRSVIAELVQRMGQHGSVAGYLHLFSASRIIERIGDHATNIAEDVQYAIAGQITRHTAGRQQKSDASELSTPGVH